MIDATCRLRWHSDLRMNAAPLAHFPVHFQIPEKYKIDFRSVFKKV